MKPGFRGVRKIHLPFALPFPQRIHLPFSLPFPFIVALGAGAGLRLVAMIGYPGALWFAGDSYVYLGAALRPQPNLSKTTGYSVFLHALEPFHSLTLVAGLQHLMGLAVAVMIYLLLRRSGVPQRWATIATLPVLLDGSAKNGQGELFTSASLDEPAGEVILKVVNAAPSSREVHINLTGARRLGKVGKVIILESSDLKAENSLDNPIKVAPIERQLPIPGGDFAYTLTPNSLTVIRVGVK